MASAVALQGTNKQAMKTHMLGADQFTEFIFTHDRNEMQNEVDFNCGKIFFWTKICSCLNCDYNCDDHIFRPSVFLQFKSTSLKSPTMTLSGNNPTSEDHLLSLVLTIYSSFQLSAKSNP